MRQPHLGAWLLTGAVLLLLVLVPGFAGGFQLHLMTELFILGLFALSLDLLLGYTGLPSFGHAAFLGLGGYTAGILARDLGWQNLLLVLPAVLLVTGLAAVVIGYLSLRTAGIFFLMVTLAFAQILYGVAIKWNAFTGGDNGLSGIPRPSLELGGLGYQFGEGVRFYYLVLVLFLVGFAFARRVVRSPFGQVLVGIRENPSRMRALGYNIWRYKLAVFVLSGMLGGVAGYLLAGSNFFVHPASLYWTTSGTVLVMVIIGGLGTLIGPVLGAGLVIYLEKVLSSQTERWEIVMGAVFILFVLFAPQGIAGLWGQARRALSRRATGPQAERRHA